MRKNNFAVEQPNERQALKIASREVAEGVISRLVEQYSPGKDEIEIEVGGEKLRFNPIVDRTNLLGIQKSAKEVQKDIKSRTALANDETKALYEGVDPETLNYCSILASLSIEPKFTVEDLLKLARKATLAFEDLREKFNKAHLRFDQTTANEEIAEAKND